MFNKNKMKSNLAPVKAFISMFCANEGLPLATAKFAHGLLDVALDIGNATTEHLIDLVGTSNLSDDRKNHLLCEISKVGHIFNNANEQTKKEVLSRIGMELMQGNEEHSDKIQHYIELFKTFI